MNTYRSSSLKLFGKHCPAALGFHEANTPRERDIFAAGIAAHAMMQGIVEQSGEKKRQLYSKEVAAICKSVGRVLMSEGRSFDGIHEPPLSPEQVFEGRDIVLEYLEDREGNLPQNGAKVEVGYAIDHKGKAVPYGSGAARYQALIDAVEIVPAEDGLGPLDDGTVDVYITEYKTAFPTKKEELDTLQCRGQAVVVAANVENITRIVHHVVNLRTGARYERIVVPIEEEGARLLELWREDVFDACDAADKTREARPGAGCPDCPFVRKCEDARMVFEEGPDGRDETPEELARRFAVTKAIAAALAAQLRKMTKDAPIKVDGGYVGYKPSPTLKPKEDAHSRLAIAWHKVDEDRQFAFMGEHSEFLSLLSATKLTKAAIENAAKRLYPGSDWRVHREKLIAELTEPTILSRFDVYRGPVPRREPEEQ